MTEKEILQLINQSETDRDRVIHLAAEHNVDLHQWYIRRRRMHRLVTDVVIAASVIAFVVIVAMPDPDGHYVSSAQARTATINTIEQTTLIAKL